MTSLAERTKEVGEVPKEAGMLLILTGRSGVGKDEIMKDLLGSDLGFKRIVTSTSRKPRPEEIDGVDYHFIESNELFEQLIKDGKMLEWQRYSDHYKGTPREAITQVLDGARVIWRIDLGRAGEISDFFRRSFDFSTAKRLTYNTFVFLIDADTKEIEERARRREGESFDPVDYARRTAQENRDIKRGTFQFQVYNRDGEMEMASGLIRQIVTRHFDILG